MKKYIIAAIVFLLLGALTFGLIELTNKSYEKKPEDYPKTLSDTTTTKAEETEKEEPEPEIKTVDLIVFAGQSNMAGNGKGARAPQVSSYSGVEFRAITDPNNLYVIDESAEPFGANENANTDTDKINDVYYEGSLCKKGDLVPSFINAYNAVSGARIVGVSASKFNTDTMTWKNPEAGLCSGLVERYNKAETWLTEQGYTINNRALVWLQGESDGEKEVDPYTYTQNTREFFDYIKENTSIENMYMISIGRHYDKFTANPLTDHDAIIEAQARMCEDYEDMHMISTLLTTFTYPDDYKNDGLHFSQQSLNALGEDAGTNMAKMLYGEPAGDQQTETETETTY